MSLWKELYQTIAADDRYHAMLGQPGERERRKRVEEEEEGGRGGRREGDGEMGEYKEIT